MKTLVSVCVAIAFVLLAYNCNCNLNSNNSEDISLTGKKATLTYPGMVANVKYINDSTIYWKSIDENDSIDEQTKAMKMRKIGNGKFFISWIGDYGVTSSQVVDLNKKTFIEFYTSADILGNRVGQMIEGKFELDK